MCLDPTHAPDGQDRFARQNRRLTHQRFENRTFAVALRDAREGDSQQRQR